LRENKNLTFDRGRSSIDVLFVRVAPCNLLVDKGGERWAIVGGNIYGSLANPVVREP